MIPLDQDFILEIAPKFSGRNHERQRAIVAALSGSFAQVLESYRIDTALRIAHFMAQIAHECAGFRTTEEFASGAAYEGRADLGNTEPGDGRRYKGRGLLQLTGRFNYRDMGARLGIPLESEPERAAEPVLSLRIACEYWTRHDINALADRDDIVAVTRKVNGGLNGLEDRTRYLRRAKDALARRAGLVLQARQAGTNPVLRRGSFGMAVISLQERLVAKGAILTIDADFGGATESALMAFQRDHGLLPDGIAGEDTWAALGA